jgi:hypothetical protein
MPSLLFEALKESSSPYINRFVSADTIVPNPTNPQSLNRYSYVTNNPLRYTDPTGHMECEGYQGSCVSENQVTRTHVTKREKRKVAHKIHKKFNNVTVQNPNAWSLRDLNEIYYGLFRINGMYGFDGNTDAIGAAFGQVTFVSVHDGYFNDDSQVGSGLWSNGVIKLEPDADADTVVHEMGHILDGGLKRLNHRVPLYSKKYANVFDAGSGATDYAQARNSPVEDFADSFLAVIKYGSTASDHVSEPRIRTINALIQSYTNSNHTLSPGR